MKLINTSELLWVLASAIFCSLFVFFQATELVENNEWKGYHCAPIVKVSTMKEAKKQIEINQIMTGVRG